MLSSLLPAAKMSVPLLPPLDLNRDGLGNALCAPAMVLETLSMAAFVVRCETLRLWSLSTSTQGGTQNLISIFTATLHISHVQVL